MEAEVPVDALTNKSPLQLKQPVDEAEGQNVDVDDATIVELSTK
jgi:hypothetical protein